MMTKSRLFLLAITAALLVSAPAMAVWDEVPQEEFLGVNNVELVEDLNIRVTSIDVEARTANVIISDSTRKVLFEGQITPEKGYTRKNQLMIRAEEFRMNSGKPQVRLDVERWVEARVEDLNFPEEMYKNDIYKVWIIVTNTGETTSTYDVSLQAPEGKVHIQSSSQDQNPKYSSTRKEFKRELTRELTIDAGKTEKVYFEIQPAGNERVGNVFTPRFVVSAANGGIIEEVTLNDVEIVNEQVGYVEDIIAQSGMLAGEKNEVVVKVRNSWMTASNDFFVTLRAPEFRLNPERTQRIKASSSRTEKLTYSVVPYGGGEFTLTAQLSIGQRDEDSLSRDVSVVGEKIYAITNVEVPDTIEPGESEMVFATVKNRGRTTARLSLGLESKEFRVQNPQAVLELGAGKETRALFNIEANTDKQFGDLTVSLYDLPENFEARTYGRNAKLTDSKTFRIGIDRPQETTAPSGNTGQDTTTGEDTQDTMDEVEEDVSAPAPDDEDQQDTQVDEVPPSKQAFSFEDLEGYWPYIAIGILVILAIILIIFGEKKRKNTSVEVYDLEEDMKKK